MRILHEVALLCALDGVHFSEYSHLSGYHYNFFREGDAPLTRYSYLSRVISISWNETFQEL